MAHSLNIICKSYEKLGSMFEIKLPNEYEHLYQICFSELERIDSTYSRFKKNSLLSRLNSNINKWQTVDDELIYLLRRALYFNMMTDKNFDITIKSALDALGYDAQYSFKAKPLPKQGVLTKILENLRDDIELDINRKRVKLRKEIEFGGFGKGYCLDKLSEILDKNGVSNYLINAGGDIKTKASNGHNWTILLEHPDDTTRAIGKLNLNNMAFAASAPNRRRWGNAHHLINSRTRMPEKSVKCIFILAKLGIEADAYSTALFTAGFNNAINLAEKLPVEMLIVSDKGKMFLSKGFKVEFFK